MKVCECGAVTTDEDAPADPRCLCPPDKEGEKVLLIDPRTAPPLDPVENVPSEYARRVKDRSEADAYYLRAYSTKGHAEAALETCIAYGHDARAGMCERCGGRLGRPVRG